MHRYSVHAGIVCTRVYVQSRVARHLNCSYHVAVQWICDVSPTHEVSTPRVGNRLTTPPSRISHSNGRPEEASAVGKVDRGGERL